MIFSALCELSRLQSIYLASKFSPDSSANVVSNPDGTEVTLYREPGSIVGSVVMMGVPLHVDRAKWREVRKAVVGSRMVNCYSHRDIVVRLLFQYKRKLGAIGAGGSVAGSCEIGVDGVEDLDVGDLIKTHDQYEQNVNGILRMVGEY